MARDLPGGTVTFLFTDVEGSTRLLDELGAERYAEVLGEHRAIVRRALELHGGVEVDTQGDAFFCAFSSARLAIACASDIVEGLRPTPIRMRMGVHTGEALLVEDHYVGLDVHRAARIGACGHGGQVVISPTTAALLEPGEFSVRDLGVHRLKDLAAPVVLYQLGEDDFPTLEALFRTNLPVPATPFLGRASELLELAGRVSEPGVRVLTLTGPGGTGKTRLALQLVAEISGAYPDGLWWVPLAALREGSRVASALAGVLGVDEEAGRDLAQSIASSVGRRKTLTLLDNCEHLVEAVAKLVATLVAECPELLLVTTSREPLAVAGEHVYAVQPLAQGDATELFYSRAHAAGANLDKAASSTIVTSLCERLDNLPLAVELAAARAAALPPAALLERLASRFDLLKGPRDVEERQRTLRAAIAWSHDLLDEPERRLFRRLGVFVGGASLDAIEEVCGADLEDVLSLVAKSLVRQATTDAGAPRYWMLETIREFAVAELAASPESDELRVRHLNWFSALARRSTLVSPEETAPLELELANLREAFGLAEARRERLPDAVALSLALVDRHLVRGRYTEAENVARRTLSLDVEPLDSALLLDRLGTVLRRQGRPAEALDSYLASERTLDAVAERDDAWWERWLDVKLDEAHFFYFQNEQQALERLVGELEPTVTERGTVEQRLQLMHVHVQHLYRKERYAPSQATEDLARAVYAASLAAGKPSAVFTLGFCLLWRGKLDEADRCLERGREVARRQGDALLETRCLVYGLVARRRLCDIESARTLLAALDEADELHAYGGLAAANGAWLAYRDGALDLAFDLGERALDDWSSEARVGSGVFQWTARFPLLGVALARGDLDAARRHARAMLDETLQPLPDTLAGALRRAIEEDGAEYLAQALELARPEGYA